MHGRITAQAGSFFEKIPAGADPYLMMRVLHNWDDAECLRILRTSRAAMSMDARLLIVEHILEPDPARGEAIQYLLDIQMMAMFGDARERTAAEYRDLLAASGLVLRRTIATPSAVWIIEALPV
jgi:hypothetical protein